MTTTTQTGAEYISAFMSNAVPDFPFNKYLSFGTLSTEDWTSQTYDPDSSKKSISFKSTAGSTIKYAETWTGTDTQGTDVGSATIIGKVNGTNMSISGSDSWTDAGGSYSTNLSWTYTGGTTTKADDFKLKASNINKDSTSTVSGGSKGASTEQKSIDFSNANYSFSVSANNSSQWIYSDSAGTNTVDKFSSNLNYSFKDIQNNSALTLSSVKLTEDNIA